MAARGRVGGGVGGGTVAGCVVRCFGAIWVIAGLLGEYEWGKEDEEEGKRGYV